jgi:cytochrome c biogenesis protein
VILLGGLLGVAFGFREFGAGVEGETYYIARGDFSVRVDRFWMDYYDTGAVKSYNSRLTIIDQGREVLARTIRVNDPLAYKGIWFYQSSYGDAWDRVAQVTLRISDRASGATLRDVVLQWQTETVLDDLGLRLTLTNFVSHFAFNPHTKTVYSKSVEHHNPAVKIMIAEGDRASVSLWLLFALPDLIQVQDSRYLFELIGYVPKKFTGLQIARDPGVGFVWVGSVMLVVGVTLSALIYHRRIWVKLLPDGQGTLVYVGGSTHKSRLDFSREFTRIVDGITRIGSHGQGESRKAGEGAACG